MSGEWFQPSKRDALILPCVVDHLIVYPRGCQRNRAFFIFRCKPVESEVCAKIIPSRNSPWRTPFRALSGRKGGFAGTIDLGMHYPTASLYSTFTPTFDTIGRRETCISMNEALKWWLKAAEQRHIEAQHWGITRYKFGLGVIRDEQEMIKWVLKLIEQEDAWGELEMEHCYACGTGVPMDDAKAIKYWRKAAKNEQPPAEYNLGKAYIIGYGEVKENKEKAIKLLRSSAEHGAATNRHRKILTKKRNSRKGIPPHKPQIMTNNDYEYEFFGFFRRFLVGEA